MSIYGDNIFTINEIYAKDLKELISEWKKKREEKRKKKEEAKKKEEEAKAKSEYEQKKKEEFNNLSESEKKEIENHRKQKAIEFDKLVRSECSKLMKDPKFIALLRKDIDKAFEDGLLDKDYREHKSYYKTNKVPKPDISEDYEGYWIILEDDQAIRIACNRLCDTLATNLSKITGYVIDIGDGDEGCIYPEPFCYNDLYHYWRRYYKND